MKSCTSNGADVGGSTKHCNICEAIVYFAPCGYLAISMPHQHLGYRLSDQTNIRAAYSSAIARPGYFSLVPYRVRDDEDLAIGNPELDPTTSSNLDLLFEHYDSRIGVLSAGVFHKSIKDPIFTFVEENNLGGDTEQPRNGESGNILGFDLSAQQQLNFLPGALSGLGIYANYTFTDSDGTLPDGRSAKLAGQADHAFNTAVSYERGAFSGQVSFNFRDSYIDAYGDEEAEDEFVRSRHQLDFSASYRLNETGTIYMELLCLRESPSRTSTLESRLHSRDCRYSQPVVTLRLVTGHY